MFYRYFEYKVREQYLILVELKVIWSDVYIFIKETRTKNRRSHFCRFDW